LEIHRDAIVVDGHNDLPLWMIEFGFDLGMDGNEEADRSPWLHAGFRWLPWRPEGDRLRTSTDLARIREGGLDAQFFSVWVSPEFYDPGDPGRARQRALDTIEVLREQVYRHADAVEMAESVDDVRRIVSSGKLAALIGLEGGHAIADDLETLRLFYREGARYMTLTWSFSHGWADSSGDVDDPDVPHHGGLSDFGREVVREMNRLGMIVDISHVSDETFWDVMEVTHAPVMASHSSVRAIADHPRNLSDDMLRGVAKNGGVVMINFFTMYLDPEKTTGWKFFKDWVWNLGGSPTPLALLADHMDHVVEVAGIDHVGLGSDFDGAPTLPDGMKDVGDYPNLTLELLRRGYSEEDLRKVLGENALRVMSAVEETAARLTGE
jgi:membrane dipeptidase